MSDNWLQFIPTDPKFRPSEQAAVEARLLLASFVPSAESVNFEYCDSITFRDPGANWSGVNCSACGGDAEPWWGDAMELFEQDPQRTLIVIAGCCGESVSLNDLEFVWPAGFASFVVEAINPNIEGLSIEQLEKLSNVVGCPLREIAVHI
jgi:hypothetical protein